MSNKQNDKQVNWQEEAKNLMSVLKKISQPPLKYATVIDVHKENTIDIAMPSGDTMVVHYDPRLKDKLTIGQTVQISPETYSAVAIKGDIKKRGLSEVKDVLKDGRIKINHNGSNRLIQTIVKDLKIGDTIVVDNSFSVALENIGNTTEAYKINQVPKIPWSKIGGLSKTIEQIKDAIELPFAHKELYSKFPNKKLIKGALLSGPPGCGKTMIGKAIAYNLALKRKKQHDGELNGYFLYAAGPEFLNKYVGVGPDRVRELFGNARATAAKNGDPVVIFIDEPEAILKKRGSGMSSDAADPIVNQFLAELDGLNGLENVILLLATNRQELLDPAILRPGRIDRKIYVPRPGKSATEEIFSLYLKDMPLQKNGVFKSRKRLVESYSKHAAIEVFDKPRPILNISYKDGSTDQVHYKSMFSGASVVSIVSRATDYAVKRGITGGKSNISKEDISCAVDTEFKENRGLTSQILRDDLLEVTKDKFDQIIDVRPTYAGPNNGGGGY